MLMESIDTDSDRGLAQRPKTKRNWAIPEGTSVGCGGGVHARAVHAGSGPQSSRDAGPSGTGKE